MYLFNLHLELPVWFGGGVVAGYVACWVRTLRKARRKR